MAHIIIFDKRNKFCFPFSNTFSQYYFYLFYFNVLTRTILVAPSYSQSGNSLAVSVARVGGMAGIFMALRQTLRSEGRGAKLPLYMSEGVRACVSPQL